MTDRISNTKEDIIDKIIEHINKKLAPEQALLVSAFCRQFYSTVAVDDLNERNIADLYGAVLSHWHFIYQRHPGESKLRVYNPNFEQNGWQSTHTIVELSQEDMPFLVDSIRMAINDKGYYAHLMIHIGGLKFKRNAEHQIIEVLSSEDTFDGPLEAFIYIEIDKESDPLHLDQLYTNIEKSLVDVRVAVEDWQAMRKKVEEAIEELEKAPPPLEAAEIAEAKDFLRWINDDHFTFLGCRDYELVGEGEEKALKIVDGSGLGVLREDRADKKLRLFSSLPPAARQLAMSSEALVISKTNTKSVIHRPAYTDYIGVKRFNKEGVLTGERRFIGLYTSTAYHSNPRHIPYLRHKVAIVLAMSRLPPKGHAGKDLLNILETLPRDDLFQATADELYTLAMGILHLQERQRIRLFVRKDIYGRYLSCLVYLPRERINTDLRQAMQEVLDKTFNAVETTFTTLFTESVLARVHYLIRVDPNKPLEYDIKELEAKLIEVGRSWQDELSQNLTDFYGEEKGNHLTQKYVKAFPAGYKDDFLPRTAVYDIEHIENLSHDNPLGLSFYRPVDEPEGILRFKLFQLYHPIPLSDVLPILENMGVRVIGERPHEIIFRDHTSVWINDFGMIPAQNINFEVEAVKDIFQEAFRVVWHGEAENDSFNRLVLSAQLHWRQITVIRTYAKYLKQIGFTFSQSYIEQTFANHPTIAKNLIDFFQLKLDPEHQPKSEAAIAEIVTKIEQQLDSVASLDEDRILRTYLELIKATLRTNYYQLSESGEPKRYLAIKLNPNSISDLPLPRPMFEVFVYSSRFEAVHLRSSKVARGGIRWSDRREDFRTEILGLMKAQKVKNAVIVPSGAKGGFVPKSLPTDGSREALMEEVVNCYKTFIRGLLDITDNLIGGVVVPPSKVVRYDDDDPYLVVAADKGTATFSDIANQISAEYGFWLGDAFASGGSAGYDHKKMGITAKGAWESVKRHFRELDFDVQSSDFTVMGIGDMSGDVFGNGMLLSRHIKLVGAFNHMHIFLDPSPDPETSFQERNRLFNLPRSGWEDYNADIISKGGGIYKRSAKSIKLSSEVQQLLNINKDQATPNEVIHALLKAKVDLLWNGGIGTYVKATHETSSDVGDRTNDAVRVNGSELQCRVIGEGGNLGLTQLGRVEYELNGGIVYTDFIDNSGGVDCSDHEVNIKILLNEVVASGDMTEKQRNTLLADMTDEVAELVLRNNYLQTQAISTASEFATKYTELYRSYIVELESLGKIDRTLEFLPDDKAFSERIASGKSLTHPELAILFAYTKSILKEEILNSDAPEDPHLGPMLESAFPKRLAQQFRPQMEKHSLRREIIATQLSNAMINELGITFAYRLIDETGAQTSAIVKAYSAARQVFDLPSIYAQIESLDLKVPSKIQFKMMTEIARLIRRATRWLLRHRRVHLDIASTVEQFAAGIADLRNELFNFIPEKVRENLESSMQTYLEAGVPEAIVKRIVSTSILYAGLDIIDAAKRHDFNLYDMAKIYFSLNDCLDLGWFRDQVSDFPVVTQWEALAREAIRDDLDTQQRDLSISILQHHIEIKDIGPRIEFWMDHHRALIDRWQKMLADLKSSGSYNFTKFFVAVRELLDLTQTSIHSARMK